MRKKLGIAIMVLGVLAGAFALVWWLYIGPQLTKLPSDIATSMDFEGDLTLWVNKETGMPLASGEEEVIPVKATRGFTALPDLFTSDTAFFEDTMTLTIGEKTADPQIAHYAVSRTSRKCVDSDENWAFTEDNKVARTGSYGPLFPSGLGVGDVVSVYYDDPAKAFAVEVVEEIADWNGLGITVLKIDASRPSNPYDPEAAEVLMVRGQGLPTEISADRFKAALRFDFYSSQAQSLAGSLAQRFGQSVPAANQVPAAVSAAIAQLEQTIADHPLTVSYTQQSGDLYFIEKTTGATVDATFDRTTFINVDLAVVEAVKSQLGGYTSLPVIGSQIAAALGNLEELAAPYRSPIKAFSQDIGMTDASQAAMAQEAKDNISLLRWVQSWIPLLAGLVGVLLLLAGVVFLSIPRKTAA